MSGAMKERAPLAAAIKSRNEAAKAVDAARTAFEALAGEPIAFMFNPNKEPTGRKHADLKSERYDAEGRLRELEQERDRLLEMTGGDRLNLHRVFISEHGANADQVLDDARSRLDKATKELATMEVAMSSLDMTLQSAEADLSARKAKVDQEIARLFESHVIEMAAGLRSDLSAIMQKVGGLRSAAASINFEHRDIRTAGHPLGDAGYLLSLFASVRNFTMGVYEEHRRIEDAVKQGAMPWTSAAAQLAVDPNAPLPIEQDLRKAA